MGKVCMDSWLLICCFQLGFLAQLTSTLILLWRVVTDPQGLQGINMKSQTMLLVASVVRVFWVMDTEFGDHHFPFIELIASILAYSGFIGYVQYQKHKGENTIYDKQNETFPVRYIYGGCAIPAVLIFFEYDQGWWGWYTSSILVGYSIFLECGAMVPQNILLQPNRGHIKAITGLTLVLLAAARFFRIMFWALLMYNGEWHKTLMLADLLHCGLLFTFCQKYYAAVKAGQEQVSLSPLGDVV